MQSGVGSVKEVSRLVVYVDDLIEVSEYNLSLSAPINADVTGIGLTPRIGWWMLARALRAHEEYHR